MVMNACKEYGRALGGMLAGMVLASALAAAEWRPVTGELLRTAKPGYGGLSGVVVEPRSGQVFVWVSDRGVYRSSDQGATWQRLGGEIRGRTEWPGSLIIDPTRDSQRMLIATVYGGPVLRGSTAGDWKAAEGKSSHVDWCAADWSDPDLRFLLALKHESGGLLLASRDGGKSFSEVGKGYGPAWIFDHDTAVVAAMKTRERPRPGLLRTTDGGRTFQACGAYAAQALPQWRDGKLYWLVEGALIATGDRGGSWSRISAVRDGRFGPVFGKDASHLFVLTGAGILESTDGGKSWSKPIALPGELKDVSALTWLQFDPKNDLLYAMKMGSQLYQRPAK